MLFVLLLFFSSAQPFFPPLRLKEMALWFFFPPLVCQSTNRFQCFVCILGGSRHQLQVWTMSEKLVQLFSLCLSVCACLYSWERARDLLWACIVSVYPSVWLCVVPTLRQNDAFSSIGGPGSNPASVERLSLSPQWKNWSMCPTSHSLHEVKRFLFFFPEKCFCANVCCLCAW